MDLQGKVVVITGGGRGIGREIALGCAKQGARLVVAARSEGDLAETKKAVQPYDSEVLTVPCDVSKPDQVATLFEKARQRGPVYGLVCAAAIHGPIGPFSELDPDLFRQVLDINVMGTVLCAQAALSDMKKKGGRMVFFSGGGEKAFPRFSAYVASKGAIWRLTETLGAELKEQGIFVNAIAPGAVNTRLLQNVLDAGPEKAGADNYQAGLQQAQEGGVSPEKAVKLVTYLLSEKSKGLTGKIISAVWDPYESWTDLEKISSSDYLSMRRLKMPSSS